MNGRSALVVTGVLVMLTGAAAADDLVVSGTTRVITSDMIVDGSIRVEDGGTLTIRGCTVTLELDYDEEHHVDVSGDSRLVIDSSTVTSTGGQYWYELYADGGASPTMEVSGADTLLTGHAGIRPFDDTVITVTGGDVEEIQLRDRVQIAMSDAAGYVVLFFDGDTADLDGLEVSDTVTTTIGVSGGWTFSADKADLYGYQIDLSGGADVTLSGSDGVVLSVHTPGDLGPQLNVVEGLTSDVPTSGLLTGLGSRFAFTDSVIEMVNIYVGGTDRVLLRGMHVNEANASDRAELIIGQEGFTTNLSCNLCQVYDDATFTVEHATVDATDQPSATASGHDVADLGRGVMTFREMDLREMDLTVMESGVMNLHNCLYDPARVEVIDPTATFNVYGLAVDFTADPRSGPAPLEVRFGDATVGEADAWSWDFGDGATSTQRDPSHTYVGPGSYTVVLEVTGPAGSNQKRKGDFIQVTAGGGGTCTPGSTALCLNDGRFRVELEWATAQGDRGWGQAVSLTGDTGYFWIFNDANVECVVKVLRACGVNGHYWVFAAGLTNVEVELTVEDTMTGLVQRYHNAQGAPFQPVQDTDAFATCP